MYIRKLTLWLVFIFYWCNGDSFDVESAQKVGSDGNSNPNVKENLKSTYSVLSQTISKAVLNENLPQETCSSDDLSCFGMDTQDKLGLEAIQALHHQLDDDRNGNVDLTETDDFLREELQYNSGYERRQKAFHRNDDMHISVKELWEAWLRSEVHNWTSQQTSEWLAINVELPQYVNNFLQYNINGAMLPRLAVNNMQLLNNLGIKDPIHKQKIALKAMDVVLFGPPKDHQPHWKDLTLIVLIIGGSIGMWYAVQQNKKFKSHLTRMNKDMEGLQHAESALENLQRELERAVEARENVVSEKQNLEKKLQEAGADSLGLHNSYSDLEVSQLKAEIEMLRHELQIAEGELKDRCWSPPVGLQHWLQLTHEIENKAYIKKKMVAEKQLQQAREACEKLRKKRSSLVGAFVSTHGKSIDDVDRSIVEARTSLNEVTQELQERVYRWKQVELLCGFNIISNSGLQQLENMLYRNTNLNGRPMTGLKGRMSSSQDDLDDDTCSLYTVASGKPNSFDESPNFFE
uniref:SAM domain-containing protein n=1 Tax=Photinus pyralis TaxID=7054 RepID=A0A1Y1MAA0_PHOPY